MSCLPLTKKTFLRCRCWCSPRTARNIFVWVEGVCWGPMWCPRCCDILVRKRSCCCCCCLVNQSTHSTPFLYSPHFHFFPSHFSPHLPLFYALSSIFPLLTPFPHLLLPPSPFIPYQMHRNGRIQWRTARRMSGVSLLSPQWRWGK